MDNISNNTTQKVSNPWQDRASIGFFKAMWETIKYVLLKPGEFFDNLEIQKSLKETYLFYFVIYSCANIISLVIAMLLKPVSNGMFVFISAALFMLLFVSIGIFITSGIWHLWIMILGGKGGFKGTFNVLAYSSASTSIFLIIPFIGGAISGIWGIIVGVKGFKRVHNFTTARAIFAYFNIIVIIFAIGILAAIAIPNILKARMNVNNATAETTVKAISTAIETYRAANNGMYPKAEDELISANPPYLSQAYDNKEIAGHKYLLELNTTSYKIVAKPISCGTTGTNIITVGTDGILQEETCNKQ